jgi:hypothetical protein
LARVGMANAREEARETLVCFTPPYRKSGLVKQMR